MKSSLLIFSFFLLGIVMAQQGWLPDFLLENDFSSYALYALVFLVGIGTGADIKQSFMLIKTMHVRILLVPFTTVIGTLLGVSIFTLIAPSFSLQDSLAVASGLGYYSLSSLYITEVKGETLGVIALLANLIRELLSLVFTPAMAKYFGKLAPIASAGATSMDTTLPVITKAVGKQYAMLSIFHGTILSILVPFLVMFILSF
ncbi:MAG: lysine exporter LysO family protein [Prevotellaceae bacterium]|jgi:uncharacterized membrane protein YbjE (DUF340 family)|nr:lysine exporter LysO family protein [Prevotellaceae bacterium]